MPKKSPHPYVLWREGRPRFVPGPELRAAGLQGKDLRHPDGRWFSKGEAVDWSAALIASRAAAPDKPKRGRPAAGAPRRRLTVGKLCEAWQLHGLQWQDAGAYALAKSTRYQYRRLLRTMEADFPQLWVSAAEAVTRPIMQTVYDQILKKRGASTAYGVSCVMKLAYKWARSRGRINMRENPASELERHLVKPRVRFATRPEIDAMVAAADAIGMPQIGDSIVLGLWTAQRQGDRLQLKHAGRIKNRRVFRQSKTGAVVHILESPKLEERLAAAAQRRTAAGKVDPHVILNERSWQPYFRSSYRADYRVVRKAAAAACPSVATLRDQDLRDTAITWMALAGASIPEIASVSGHSVQSVYSIMKHYLATHPEMADTAIRKMIEWYDGGGETEIG